MADGVPPPHTDPKRPVPELTAYLAGKLEPAARAAFEAHLPVCDRCRKGVEVTRNLFPGVVPAAAKAGPTSAQDWLAVLDAERARLRAELDDRQGARRRLLLWSLALLTAAMVAGAVGFARLDSIAARRSLPPALPTAAEPPSAP